jgi:bifunctional DNA-binding transcriptional regulator/antitoxin component of YhaV-PrlF toxin-antitoxin module
MITKMTGTLTRVHEDDIRVEVGPFEYQVLVPESVRRQLQLRAGQEVALHITEYLEGNSGGNRFIPRKLGFTTAQGCSAVEVVEEFTEEGPRGHMRKKPSFPVFSPRPLAPSAVNPSSN